LLLFPISPDFKQFNIYFQQNENKLAEKIIFAGWKKTKFLKQNGWSFVKPNKKETT